MRPDAPLGHGKYKIAIYVGLGHSKMVLIFEELDSTSLDDRIKPKNITWLV